MSSEVVNRVNKEASTDLPSPSPAHHPGNPHKTNMSALTHDTDFSMCLATSAPTACTITLQVFLFILHGISYGSSFYTLFLTTEQIFCHMARLQRGDKDLLSAKIPRDAKILLYTFDLWLCIFYPGTVIWLWLDEWKGDLLMAVLVGHLMIGGLSYSFACLGGYLFRRVWFRWLREEEELLLPAGIEVRDEKEVV
jgi:hypothetical protein